MEVTVSRAHRKSSDLQSGVETRYGPVRCEACGLLERINFEQIRVFKTSVTRFEYISIVLQNMMDSFTPKVLLAGRKNG